MSDFMLSWRAHHDPLQSNLNKYNGGKEKMATLKETAKAYEPVKTKNIADLDEVSIDLELEERSFTDRDGKNFTISITKIDGEEYRVPRSVIKSLKQILVAKPNLKVFSVTKSGEGLTTEYTVIPLR